MIRHEFIAASKDSLSLDLMFETNASTIIKKAITDFQPECIGISVRNIDDQNFEAPVFLLDKVKGDALSSVVIVPPRSLKA